MSARLLDLIRLFRDDQQRHDLTGLLAPGAVRSNERRRLEGLTRRQRVAVHAVQNVASLAHADHLSLNAHRVQAPVDGVAHQQRAEAAAQERPDQYANLIEGGYQADEDIKHCNSPPGPFWTGTVARRLRQDCERLLASGRGTGSGEIARVELSLPASNGMLRRAHLRNRRLRLCRFSHRCADAGRYRLLPDRWRAALHAV